MRAKKVVTPHYFLHKQRGIFLSLFNLPSHHLNAQRNPRIEAFRGVTAFILGAAAWLVLVWPDFRDVNFSTERIAGCYALIALGAFIGSSAGMSELIAGPLLVCFGHLACLCANGLFAGAIDSPFFIFGIFFYGGLAAAVSFPAAFCAAMLHTIFWPPHENHAGKDSPVGPVLPDD